MHMNDVQLLHFKRYLEKECRLLEIGQLLDANRKVLASVEREYLKREEMNALMNKHVRERARPRRRRRRARGSVSFVDRRLTAYPHPLPPRRRHAENLGLQEARRGEDEGRERGGPQARRARDDCRKRDDARARRDHRRGPASGEHREDRADRTDHPRAEEGEAGLRGRRRGRFGRPRVGGRHGACRRRARARARARVVVSPHRGCAPISFPRSTSTSTSRSGTASASGSRSACCARSCCRSRSFASRRTRRRTCACAW